MCILQTTMTTEWYSKESVPKKYRQWAADYDKSATLHSYNQLKSSAKYLFSKLRTNSVEDSAEGVISQQRDDPVNKGTIILGNGGDIFHQSEHGCITDTLSWYPFYKIKKGTPSLEDRPLFVFDKDVVQPYKNVVLNKTFNPDSVFPLYFSRYPDRLNLLCTFSTGGNGKDIMVSYSSFHEKTSYRRVPLDTTKDIEYVWYSVDSKDYFVVFDKTNSILNVFDYKTADLVDKFSVEVYNSHPVFDLKGSVLMYVPTADVNIEKRNLTPVNLSSKKNLLNKLIVTFSNTALDSMFMFSEVTQQKIKSILEVDKANEDVNKKDDADSNDKPLKCHPQDKLKNEKLKDNYRDIFTEIYNTISKNSAYVCAVDLKAKKRMFQLSVPSGCSKLSISPFDLQFVTANNRGDELFLWDYTKAYDSIVLMDKYNRGKTSAIIDQIEWGTGNSSIICLSRQNGSLHYFVNESLRNYEDLKVRKTERKSKGGYSSFNNGNAAHSRSISSNSWCLSHLKFKSFKVVRPLLTKDFIVAVDQNNEVLTIDIESGCIDGVINLQKKSSSAERTAQGSNTLPTVTSPTGLPSIESELLNQEIEVETCKPFLPAYNNKKYKFTEVSVTIGDSNIFNDVDSNTKIVKEYNIAGVLYKNRLDAKKIAISNSHETPLQPLTDNSLRDISKETLVHSPEENVIEEVPARSSHESSSDTLREAGSQTLQKAC